MECGVHVSGVAKAKLQQRLLLPDLCRRRNRRSGHQPHGRSSPFEEPDRSVGKLSLQPRGTHLQFQRELVVQRSRHTDRRRQRQLVDGVSCLRQQHAYLGPTNPNRTYGVDLGRMVPTCHYTPAAPGTRIRPQDGTLGQFRQRRARPAMDLLERIRAQETVLR